MSGLGHDFETNLNNYEDYFSICDDARMSQRKQQEKEEED